MPKILEWESGVYSIRNTVNDKRYIGSAAHSLRRRILDHKYRLNSGTHVNKHLQNAWRRYGPTSFKFTILVRCHPESCLEKEQEYLDKFKSFLPECGYNICPTAGSRLGVKLDEETCTRFSKTARIVMNDPLVREKLSLATKKAMERPSVRAKISRAAKARFLDPGERERASIAAKECQSRPEVIAKRKESLAKSKPLRSKISKDAWKTQDRNLKAYRPDWKDEEYRRRQSQAMKDGWAKRKIKLQKEKSDEQTS